MKDLFGNIFVWVGVVYSGFYSFLLLLYNDTHLTCVREKKIYFKTDRVNCKDIPPYSDIKIKLNQCKTRYVNIKKKVQIYFNIKLQMNAMNKCHLSKQETEPKIAL